jgi:hypothetical protein
VAVDRGGRPKRCENAGHNSNSQGFDMSNAWPARRHDAVLLAALLAAAPLMAHAQVYKCVQANGTTGYQSTPCAAGDKPAAHPSVAQLNAQRAAAPKDDKPYDDPYAGDASSRPHPDVPATRAPASRDVVDLPPGRSTSGLVADVQARNRRENEQHAYMEAHKNDKRVDMAACNAARHNLGVLSEQRPVYSYDNKGNRNYVEDKDRAGRIAETQRLISERCP